MKTGHSHWSSRRPYPQEDQDMAVLRLQEENGMCIGTWLVGVAIFGRTEERDSGVPAFFNFGTEHFYFAFSEEDAEFIRTKTPHQVTVKSNIIWANVDRI